ncbi:MAG: AmmeMemoRadiSam system protein B [Gemmatimonadales bacterium]
MSTDVRRPAVAGYFYPDDPDDLRGMVEQFLGEVDAERRRARGAIAPHAGLVYSGQCAAHVFARVEIPRTVVILAPNHTGRLGAPGGASLWRSGAFDTPLGPVPIDSGFASMLESECDLVAHDPEAHAREHAVEVELPFLRLLAPDSAIVPLVLAWDDWDRCKTLGAALAEAIEKNDGPVLLVASSDMTHYEPADRAAEKDRAALAAVEKLDGELLLRTCHDRNVTMCGRAPAATVLEAARRQGAGSAEVVDYRHSGMVTGDDSSVVAYAGVVVS